MLSKIIFVPIAILMILFSSLPVLAASSLVNGGEACSCEKGATRTAECTKYCTGDYSLNDIVKVGVKATDILLALSGSVALLFFIYGGITFLISGGSSEKVSKGKQIIINSIIGLIIVFTSFMIIQFTMDALGYSSVFGAWNQSK